jgi:hypothetical protein
VAQVLDSTSTEGCFLRPWREYHEGKPPTALVRSKAGLSLFEVGGGRTRWPGLVTVKPDASSLVS